MKLRSTYFPLDSKNIRLFEISLSVEIVANRSECIYRFLLHPVRATVQEEEKEEEERCKNVTENCGRQ